MLLESAWVECHEHLTDVLAKAALALAVPHCRLLNAKGDPLSAWNFDHGEVVVAIGTVVGSIVSSRWCDAFVFVKPDDTIVCWGSVEFDNEFSGVKYQLTGGELQVASSNRAFAAVKANGSVVSWGSR